MMRKKLSMIALFALTFIFPCACSLFDPVDSNESSSNSVAQSVESNCESEESMGSEESTGITESVEESAESVESAESTDESSEEASSSEEESNYWLVQFDTDGAGDIEAVQVEKGGKLTLPEEPKKTSKDCEYTFLGWFLGEEQWDFENGVVTEDMTLVAHWKEENKYSEPFLPKD